MKMESIYLDQGAVGLGAVELSWWPEALRLPIQAGQLTHSAMVWCQRWLASQIGDSTAQAPADHDSVSAILSRWLDLSPTAARTCLESLGLAARRELIRGSVSGGAIAQWRAELGAARLQYVIKALPSLEFAAQSRLLNSDVADADSLLTHCYELGCQIILTYAFAAPTLNAGLLRHLELRLPRTLVENLDWQLTRREAENVQMLLLHLLKSEEDAS